MQLSLVPNACEGAVADVYRSDLDVPARSAGPGGLGSVSPLGPFDRGLGAILLVLLSAAAIGLGTGLEAKLGAAALAAIAVVLAVLLRPAVAVLTVVAVTPVICALKRGLIVPGLRPSEVLITAVAAPVLIFAGSRVPVRWRLLDFMALAYVMGTFVLGAGDMLARGTALTSEMTGQLIGPLQYFLLYRSVVVALDTAELRRQAVRLLLLGSVPVSITALLQFFNVGPSRALIKTLVKTIALDGGVPRATGIMENWHSLGGYMLVTILLCAALLLDTQQQVISRRSLGVILSFAAAAMTVALTIGPVIGAIVGSIWLGASTGRSRKVIGWLAVGALAMVVLLGPFLTARLDQQFKTQVGQASGSEGPTFLPQTVRYRIEIWKNDYLPLVSSNLLTGYGPGIPPNVNWRYTEMLYITLLLKGGVPLLVIYAGMMFAAWSLARSLASSPLASPQDRCIAQVGLVLILLLVPMHIINPYFTNTGLAHPLWIIFGLVSGAAGRLGTSRAAWRTEENVEPR